MPLNRRSIQKPVRGRAASDRLVEDAPEDGLVFLSRQKRPDVAQIGPRRPYRLSTTERSFSSSLVTDLTLSQKEQLQASGRTKDEISQLSNEVTFLQKLSHPAVVKYEGVVRTESYLNIILE
jgi:serine/threonine protein kinase